MNASSKRLVKNALGELPLTAELYWRFVQQGRPINKSFSLRKVERNLPAWLAATQAARKQNLAQGKGRKILLFATLRYWVEHASLLSLALAGLGHEVTLGFAPYHDWRNPLNRFDERRQNAHAVHVLRQMHPLVETVSFLKLPADATSLPQELGQAVAEGSLRDAQYTLQVEDVRRDDDLYRLRQQRNTQAARTAVDWFQRERPDVLLTPNGSILEMGAVYQAAVHLGVPTVTYEFGEQRDRIWLAQDAEVMQQDTSELWRARGGKPLSPSQLEQVQELFSARQRASLWENFSRRWQGQPSQGESQARAALGLDERPVFLLAANVIGDSLTLGRQVFSESMTEWLSQTAQRLAGHRELQFVVRIHPGERITKGPSVAEVVRRALPGLEAGEHPHIHLVEAEDSLNTYDLIEAADLALVYTTTVGMEAAMSGLPVIVAGRTHYRSKGFTLDPTTWGEYFDLLDRAASDSAGFRPTREQVDRAWEYAYRFFFEYPCPFPWHLVGFFEEAQAHPLEQVLSTEGQQEYGAAFRWLSGEPRIWDRLPWAEEGRH